MAVNDNMSMTSDEDSTAEQLLLMDEKIQRNLKRRKLEETSSDNDTSSSSCEQEKDECDDSSLSSSSSSEKEIKCGLKRRAQEMKREGPCPRKKEPLPHGLVSVETECSDSMDQKQHNGLATTTTNITGTKHLVMATKVTTARTGKYGSKEDLAITPSHSPRMETSLSRKSDPSRKAAPTDSRRDAPKSAPGSLPSIGNQTPKPLSNPYKKSPSADLHHPRLKAHDTVKDTAKKISSNGVPEQLPGSMQKASTVIEAFAPKGQHDNAYIQGRCSAGLRSADNPTQSQERHDDISPFFDSDADSDIVEIKQEEFEGSRMFSKENASAPFKVRVPGPVSLSPTAPCEDSNSRSASSDLEADVPMIVLDQEELQEEPASEIIDFASQQETRTLEIHHSLYKPAPFQPKPVPLVHSFDLRTRPMRDRKKLRVREIFSPPVSQMWKSKFQTFNHLQSEVLNVLAHSNDNFLISSPTGSGKSTIFDIAMARLIMNDLQSQKKGSQRPASLGRNCKMVYVAPNKALCEERYVDWRKRLSDLNSGIVVKMITGDAEPGEAFTDLAEAHLVVTTPEKFDSLSRGWTENFYLFATIKLFMLDEIHLLGDSSRGWCLETIICRMKTIQRAVKNIQLSGGNFELARGGNSKWESIAAIALPMRMVAVSATLPNIEDVAELVDANECYTFDASYRPVPLKTHVIGLGHIGKNQFQFWNTLDRRVPELIQRFSNGKPTIVFCHSKKETEKLADLLTQSNQWVGSPSSTFNGSVASAVRDTKLQRCLIRGIAYHHAGLDAHNRRLIEKGFSDGNIRILCATSTLAMGVNLPVHLVVIKGTTAWRGSGTGYKDLDVATLLQMTGRAGRPGFDTSGTAVIMTDNASKQRIEKLSHCLDEAESQLQHKLTEVINSEISQRVITSSEDALNWIKGTFFFARVRKNPKHFGIKLVSDQSIDAYLLYQCETEIRKLQAMGLIATNMNHELVPLPATHIMSRNLVGIQASELLVGLPFDASLHQILFALTQIEDLQRPVRRNEKSKLNEAHRDIRFKLDGPPSKIRIQKPFEKAFVLLQCSIGQIYLEDYTLRHEMSSMNEYACRMLSALEEYSAKGSRNGHVAAQSLKLRRSLATSLWQEGDGVLGPCYFGDMKQEWTKGLRMSGITTLAHVMKSSEEALAKAVREGIWFGTSLRRNVQKLIHSTLKLSAIVQLQGSSGLPDHIVCRLEARYPEVYQAPETKDQANLTYTVVAYSDKPGGCLLFQENVLRPTTIKFRCPNRFGLVIIQAIASVVGLDEKMELKGNEQIKKSAFTASSVARKSVEPPKRLTQTKIKNTQKERTEEVYAPKSSIGALLGTAGNHKELRIAKTSVPKRPAESTRDGKLKKATIQKSPAMGSCSVLPDAWSAQAVRPLEPVMPKNPIITQLAISDRPLLSPETRNMGYQQSVLRARQMEASTPHEQTVRKMHPSRTSIHQTPTSEMAVGSRAKRTSSPNNRESICPTFQRTMSSSTEKHRSKSWRQEKREQEKKQVRAFTKKTDNPFASYKHDPNDAESFLEDLNSGNEKFRESTLIPQQELQALRNSANQRSCGVPIKKFTRTENGRSKRRTRSFPSSQRMSAQDILAMKAAEQQAYANAESTRAQGSVYRQVSPMPQFPLSQHLGTPGDLTVITNYERQPFMNLPRRMPIQHPYNREVLFYSDSDRDRHQEEWTPQQEERGFQHGQFVGDLPMEDGLVQNQPEHVYCAPSRAHDVSGNYYVQQRGPRTEAVLETMPRMADYSQDDYENSMMFTGYAPQDNCGRGSMRTHEGGRRGILSYRPMAPLQNQIMESSIGLEKEEDKFEEGFF